MLNAEGKPPSGGRHGEPWGLLLETAERAARAAGKLQMEWFRCDGGVEVFRRHDLKLKVDRMSEETIASVIRRSFPDHGILGEETGRNPGRSDHLWIVDPLDGSVNYHHGIPHFCVSLACQLLPSESGMRRETAAPSTGEPMLGVVYAPVTDELFCGVRGGGATCNGQPIRVGDVHSLEEAVIGFSFGSREETMRRMCAMSASLARDSRKLRAFGATALDMAYVACGRMSGLIQGRVRRWDFAAAQVILEESGGLFRAREVDPGGWEIIACAPALLPHLENLAGDVLA
jgi:myo-inositol-1(or 4)-monophosphatase